MTGQDHDIDALAGMGEEALAALARTAVRDHDIDSDERDAPLCWSYALRRRRWDAADWAGVGGGIDPFLSDTWDYNACVRSLLACALRALLTGTGWFSCSRSKRWWSKPGRFKEVPYSYDLVMRALDWLLANGLFEEVRAAPFDHLITGLQSKYRATELAVLLFPEMEFEHVTEFQELRIRSTDRTMKAVPDTEETRAMRAEVRDINEWIEATFSVILPPTCRSYGDGHVAYDNAAGKPCYVRWDGTVRFYRQFCRGNTTAGGRLYSDFQNLPSEMRSGVHGIRIVVDGVAYETVEKDFTCQHARMLEARIGRKLRRDPYRVEGAYVFEGIERKYDRDEHGKLAYHIAVNSKGWIRTVLAIKRGSEKRAAKKKRPELALSFVQAATLLRAVKNANACVASAFASDSGVGLQRDDSDIAIAVTNRCMAAGVPVLPVHDSFIVRKKDEAFIDRVMEEEMQAYEARFAPSDVSDVVTTEAVTEEPTPQNPVGVPGVLGSVFPAVGALASRAVRLWRDVYRSHAGERAFGSDWVWKQWEPYPEPKPSPGLEARLTAILAAKGKALGEDGKLIPLPQLANDAFIASILKAIPGSEVVVLAA